MFPYDYLGRVELLGDRGDRKGLIRYHPDSNQPQMLALVWINRDRRYFISTAFGLEEGEPYRHDRYRQLVQGCKHASAKKVELVFSQPKLYEAYYNTCSAIDQHNRHRVDTLGIEKKVKTKNWSKRVNISILSMILIDCWQVWRKITTNTDGETTETQKEFYGYLATELIKNKYDDRVGSNKRQSVTGSPLNGVLNPDTQEPRAGEGIHLTPTKRKRIDNEGNLTNWVAQGRCMHARRDLRPGSVQNVLMKLTLLQVKNIVDGCATPPSEECALLCI